MTVHDLESQREEGERGGSGRNLSLTIQTVRRIAADIALRPMEARHRVIIVDDAETMQETAQEAFLKTLEEPPPYAVILLLTADAELLLPTIRSRCTTIHLQTVLPERIVEALGAAGVDDASAVRIADASMGRPGWAFDAANRPELLAEREEVYQSVLRWIRGDRFARMAEAIRLGDAFGKDRQAVFARLAVAQAIWRSCMLQTFHLDPGASEGGLIPAVGEISPHDALDAMRSVRDCIADLEANVRPRLALQTMVLRWPAMS